MTYTFLTFKSNISESLFENSLEVGIKLFKEILLRYNSNNRSSNGISCCYLSPDGKKCAVGFYLKPDALAFAHDYEISKISIDAESLLVKLKAENITDIFEEEYANIPLEIWQILQKIHDTCDWWDENGFTSRGKEMLANSMDEKIYNMIFDKDGNIIPP